MLNDEQQVQFTRLWTEAQPSVAGYVRAVVRDAHLAKDIVQDTALVLLRKFEHWDSSREFLPWAMGFAKFEVLAHCRDSARSRLIFDESLLDAITESWPSTVADFDREQSALQDCLKTLSPKAREIVTLRYYRGLDTATVAQRLSLTGGAARVALMRIRRQLFDCVDRRLRSIGSET